MTYCLQKHNLYHHEISLSFENVKDMLQATQFYVVLDLFKICLDFFSNPLHVVIKIVLVLHIARIFGLKTAVLVWFIINCYTLTSLPEIFCPIMLIKCWGFFQYIWFIHYLNKMHCVFDKRICFNLLIVKWTNFKGRNISEIFS